MEKHITDNKKSLRFDVYLIASLLIIALVAVGILLLARKGGDRVTVEISGKTLAEYSLYENGEYSLNGGTNILVIENGEAYLSYADCPDHTCVRTGRIKYAGQSIVCLPNELTVSVRGNSDGGVDLIS